MTPADPASTVGHVDIWADPASGLPLMVEIFSRGSARPALESQFFQVSPWRPDSRVLTPVRAPGTGFTVTNASNLAGALSNLAVLALPGQLAGRDRLPVPAGFEAIGVYGGGLATFVVLGVRGSAGQNLVADALSAGGTALTHPGGSGRADQRAADQRGARPPGRLVADLPDRGHGRVPRLLEQAATTLVTDQDALP